jgi:class 3 adenylate cyclase/pimeloyl-ACP methyl ester carboxylesterase
MAITPTTRYAKSGEASIAYQVMGEGPLDLVSIGGPVSHLDVELENPLAKRAYERMASFARLVRFDRRGTGLSDPVESPPTLEQQMDDLCAVMDAAGLEQTALWGGSDVGLGAMFAGTYPERVTALILWGVAARGEDIITPAVGEQMLDALEHYGEGRFVELYAPSRAGDEQFKDWWARYTRAAASPGMARKVLGLFRESDLTDVLPTIQAPTLVQHCTGDKVVPVELGRDLASRIPNAKFMETPGIDNYPWTGDWESEVEPILNGVEEFLTGERKAREPDRVLATVLFTDIVGSTERAATLGDRRWRELLGKHDAIVREQLGRWRGREVKTVGDGFLATFDGPARALRCADAIIAAVEEVGVRVRAGVHTGECERIGNDVGGIAVHIGARVAALAEEGEVLASSTVKDLVAGSGLSFGERGTYELKGVPGEWRLFALEREVAQAA